MDDQVPNQQQQGHLDAERVFGLLVIVTATLDKERHTLYDSRAIGNTYIYFETVVHMTVMILLNGGNCLILLSQIS